MKKFSLFLLLVTVVSLTGCVPVSVNEIYTDDDIITNSALEGIWEDPESDEKYIFTALDSNSYKMVIQQEGFVSGVFRVHLVKLGETVFMDVTPQFGTAYEDYYDLHFIILHSFFKVDQIGPTLKISSINYDWLKKYIKDNPDEIQYSVINDLITFNAPTKDMQAFLLKYHNADGAYDDPSDLIRK